MSNIKNLELIDDIRRDAIIFMEQDSSLDYIKATNKARENLIGNQKITSVDLKPFTVNIDDSLTVNDNINDISKPHEEEDLYLKELKEKLKGIINVDIYDKEQLRQILIGKEMGINIDTLKKIADNKYSYEQIRYLCVMSTCGMDISKYIGDYDFNPLQAFAELSVTK